VASTAWNGNSCSASPTLFAANQRACSSAPRECTGPGRASNILATTRNMNVDSRVGVGAGGAGNELHAKGAAELDLQEWRRELEARWDGAGCCTLCLQIRDGRSYAARSDGVPSSSGLIEGDMIEMTRQ
jgi:hypothetical protein